MSARCKLWRGKRCRWLLIAICSALLTLLTRNATAITVTPANGGAAINAATNYQQNRNYEDAAAAAAAVVTATMNAAALPMAKTTNDYAQHLPRYYAALTADGGNANLAATEPIYRNYFENTDTGNGDKTDAATLILRDHMAQWHLPAAGGHATAATTTDESSMTAAGFVPTTMTAAGQHYVASTSADAAAAVGHAHAGVDFSTSGARLGGDAARGMSDTGAAYTYEYAMPKGKIDYELNEANYQSAGNVDNKDNGSGSGNGAHQVAVTVAEGGAHMSAADAYDMYKYDVSEYARQMQRALSTASVGGKEAHYATTAVDESGNQGVSGGGDGGTYFENQLPSYENYFMPTYQLAQFSNYHSPQAEQELKRQQRQNEQPAKADATRQEEQRTQLRPLTLFDSADDNNALLQQYKKNANIENYVNDRQKLHYFAKQPQLEQQQQPQQQQQQRQQQSQQQYQEQQHLQAQYQQQQLQKQVNQLQQKLSQQPQQLQLPHQLRKFPELMHFAQHQHLPRQRQRLATTLSKVTRSQNPLALPVRRRRQQRRDATSRQVIASTGTQSSQPTLERVHADAGGSDKSNSNSNINANGDTTTLQSRLRNDKRSISENFMDITGEPTQFSYARVYPTHVSQLLDDSANEIDDTPNNIDDNDVHNSNSDDNYNEDEDETNRRDQQQHYFTAISHAQVKPYRQQHNGALVQQYVLPPITTSERHTPASTAALAGIPLARHVEVTKHIAAVDYERVHVPYNHSVPIRIPQPIITAVPRPYPIRVPVAKTIAVPKVQEVRIPIEKVKPYPVERPVPFVVERRVPYMVEKQVAKPVYYPYPVKVPIVKTIVHKIPRRTHSYTTYQPHANSYPISLGQYHLQQQPHLESHPAPSVHYAHPEHLG